MLFYGFPLNILVENLRTESEFLIAMTSTKRSRLYKLYNKPRGKKSRGQPLIQRVVNSIKDKEIQMLILFVKSLK